MLLTGCRSMALRLPAAVVLALGIVAASLGQQSTVAPRDARAPGAPPAPDTRPKPQRPAEPLESLFDTSKGLPPIDRLAGTPNMFGDFFAGGMQLAVSTPAAPTAGTFDLPLAGGTQRLKVSENNSALVQDRFELLYNHHQNALDGSRTFGTLRVQTFLYVDLSAGYWLYRNRCSDGLTGLASLAELADNTICRVGCALPLGTGDNRCFDSELQVQLERRF
jgi:hypothetical protein